jgi:hypothetical protein
MYNVFIYCGGKCGSSTLDKTMLENRFDSVKLHNNNYWQNELKNHKTIFETINQSSLNYEKIYIIDVYRTPIERKISSFFQNINVHLPNYNEFSIEEMIQFFNKELIYTLEEYHSINEVFDYYNIEKFNSFNFKKKYNMITRDNKIFIKLLFSDLNNWDTILSEIFGKKIFICSDNLTESKTIYELYFKFKELYKVPKRYIYRQLLNDIEFKIYNTKDQQVKYINNWINKSY